MRLTDGTPVVVVLRDSPQPPYTPVVAGPFGHSELDAHDVFALGAAATADGLTIATWAGRAHLRHGPGRPMRPCLTPRRRSPPGRVRTTERDRLAAMRVDLFVLAALVIPTAIHAQPGPAPATAACSTADDCLQKAGGPIQKHDFAAAVPYLRRACDLGSAWGCAGLAQRYERGEGIGQDVATAVVHYVKACDLGANNACYNLAGIRWRGAAGAVDPAEAIRLMQRACDLGQPKGCEQVTAYQAALAQQAAAAPDARCAKGDLDGCAAQASDLIDHDNTRALAITTKACKKGHLRSCALQGIAMSYISARGWQAKAFKLWRRACDGGDTVGCRELGLAHDEGLVGKPDPAKAEAMFELSCAGADPDPVGCNRAAIAAYGHSAFAHQLELASRSCALEDAEGCDWVGVAAQHLGDWAGAAKAYEWACDHGVGHGCSMLEGWYSPGGGNPNIKPDPARAAAYTAKWKAARTP